MSNSIDHPSYIKRKLTLEENLKFYGRWAAACTCGDVLAMGATPKGFSLDLSAPLETEVSDIEAIMEGVQQTLTSLLLSLVMIRQLHMGGQ
ncbi:hypothetical protein QD47_11020 [Paenibacillus terrae]|uniref:PurM-like N-terminal domain-containing protein n=1 Tax=Paenibacillus terrae TaxID=159743 RepID=A0A0D7X290_9BACL|nr:hypothetical protein QD47_11020 [Paenibacillus terrae]